MKSKKISIFISQCIFFLIYLFGCQTTNVNSLINNGFFTKASELCRNLKGGEQKDCYKILIDACLKKNDYESAAKYYIDANKNIIFADDFNDNNNKWFENINSKEVYNKVQDGKYIFEHKRNKGAWYSWPQTMINIDESSDFKIETSTTKITGTNSHSYDIVWGFKNINNCYTFGISGNGSYSYGKMVNGKWKTIVPWTECEHIQKNNATNTLAVRKSGNKLLFYINDHFIFEKPFEKFFGKKVGFCLNNNMKIAFDNIIVSQLPQETEILKKLLETELVRGNYPSFLNNYQKGGYTINQAYLRVAETYFDKGDYKSATIYLKRAGWSVKNPKKTIIFKEDFKNNKNKWYENINSKEVFYKVQDGKYIFEHKRDKGTWYSWPQMMVDINESGDFRIETTMTKISGVNDNAYDIVWGLKDVNNCYTFGISGNGSYIVGKIKNGKWVNIINWTKSSYINNNNLTNSLSVEKSDDKLKFYINGQFVNESPYQNIFGNKIGFSLNNKMKVEIDKINITQIPPKIVYALAAQIGEETSDKETKPNKNLPKRDMMPVETPTKRLE